MSSKFTGRGLCEALGSSLKSVKFSKLFLSHFLYKDLYEKVSNSYKYSKG